MPWRSRYSRTRSRMGDRPVCRPLATRGRLYWVRRSERRAHRAAANAATTRWIGSWPWGACLGLLVSRGLGAYDLPAINLGYTSFLDGYPPTGSGWLFQQYLQFYRDARLKDAHNGDLLLPVVRDGKVELEKAQIDLTISLTQITYRYYPPNQKPFLGGTWGLNLMLPFTYFDLDSGEHRSIVTANQAILSDVVASPFIQIDPIVGANGFRLVQRIELQLVLPTGEYDPSRSINPGSNYVSFNPFWAGTAFAVPRWTFSWRLYYLWNGENDHPKTSLEADTAQAGQAVYLNFAGAYDAMPSRLRIGINGYYLKQIADSKVDGKSIPHSEEQVFGIGPGLVYHVSKQDHVFLNAYWETWAEDHTQGSRTTLRYLHLFPSS